MKKLFDQTRGSTSHTTNMLSLARSFGLHDSEVVYAKAGTKLANVKGIYDSNSATFWLLPGLTGSEIFSFDAPNLVTNKETIDLTVHNLKFENYHMKYNYKFELGFEVITNTQVVSYNNYLYRWDGDLPKSVPAGSTPESAGGVGAGAWVSVGDASLRGDLRSKNGAGIVVGSSGRSVQSFIDGSVRTTSQLEITTSDQLIAALEAHGAIIVNSDVIIDKYTIIPSHSNVINGGGLLRLVNSDSCISIRPNVRFDCDVSISSGVSLSVSAFHIDGKIDNPRWYVADHDTYIKSNVRSDDIDGVCLFLDAISEDGRRALISGLRADIILYRMKVGILARTDGREITSGNTYISSNTINMTASGTRTILAEIYSSGDGTKPANEEIGGNVYNLEHQPTISTEYKVIRLDGRMNRLHCNLWDTGLATNEDVVVINGDDNSLTGPNLPAINSKYVKVNGKRCSYSGHTYGVPELKLNRVHAERGIKFGGNGDFKGYGVAYVTQTPRDITTTLSPVVTKNILIEEFRRPYFLRFESFSRMSNAKYLSQISVGASSFSMNTDGIGGDIYHNISILVTESQLHIISSINGEVKSSSYTVSVAGNTQIKFEVARESGTGVNLYNVLTGGTDNI